MKAQYPSQHFTGEMNHAISENIQLNHADKAGNPPQKMIGPENEAEKQKQKIHAAEILLKHFWGHNFESDALH